RSTGSSVSVWDGRISASPTVSITFTGGSFASCRYLPVDVGAHRVGLGFLVDLADTPAKFLGAGYGSSACDRSRGAVRVGNRSPGGGFGVFCPCRPPRSRGGSGGGPRATGFQGETVRAVSSTRRSRRRSSHNRCRRWFRR